MKKIKISADSCKGCGLCIKFCPKGLIKPSKSLNSRGVKPAVFKDSGDECTACMICAQVCPECCIEVYKQD